MQIVHGTAPLEKLVLMCGQEPLYTIQPKNFADIQASPRIRISWEGARIRGRARKAIWDGKVQLVVDCLLKTSTFAFDSPAEGIIYQDESCVSFTSSTVGDVDGLDLLLENGRRGSLIFSSKIGRVSVNLSELGKDSKEFDFGGVGLKVKVQRYPEKLPISPLILEHEICLQEDKINPLLIKAVQEDGQIAWSSPIYITPEDS